MNIPIVVLLLGVVLLTGIATILFVRPMRNVIIQAAANRRTGPWMDPEFRRRKRNLEVIHWLANAAQLVLLGIAALSRPSPLGWAALAILFVISIVAGILSSRASLRLLTRGLK